MLKLRGIEEGWLRVLPGQPFLLPLALSGFRRSLSASEERKDKQPLQQTTSAQRTASTYWRARFAPCGEPSLRLAAEPKFWAGQWDRRNPSQVVHLSRQYSYAKEVKDLLRHLLTQGVLRTFARNVVKGALPNVHIAASAARWCFEEEVWDCDASFQLQSSLHFHNKNRPSWHHRQTFRLNY